MRYPDKMDRPLSDDDRRWLNENNMDHVVRQFDAEDGVEEPDDSEEEVVEETQPLNYGRMTVPDLVKEIQRRNEEIMAEDPDATPIPTDGKKADLIGRLEEDDAAVAQRESE